MTSVTNCICVESSHGAEDNIWETRKPTALAFLHAIEKRRTDRRLHLSPLHFAPLPTFINPFIGYSLKSSLREAFYN